MENTNQMFENFVGQTINIENLKIFISSSRTKCEPLDHVLISGPSGMGKTHLCESIAVELEKKLIYANGANFRQPSDIISIMTKLSENDILFIDEIHGIKAHVQETFYSIMQDYRIDLIIGNGNDKRSISFEIPPFTLIGATNHPGLLNPPFYNRFPIKINMHKYNLGDFEILLNKYMEPYKTQIHSECVSYLYKITEGNPRKLKHLTKRIADFSPAGLVMLYDVKKIISRLGLHQNGILADEIVILKLMFKFYKMDAVGIDKLCQIIDVDKHTYTTIHEPKLIKNQLIVSTPRGRQLTKKAIKLIREYKDEY